MQSRRPAFRRAAAILAAASIAATALSGAQSVAIDFGSVRSIEVNKSFPNAARLKAELIKGGYRWSDDLWFGPDIPDFWGIKIGAEVDVKAARAIVQLALDAAKFPLNVQVMANDDGFGNRTRVYIGGFDLHNEKFLSDEELGALLSGKLGQSDYASMGR